MAAISAFSNIKVLISGLNSPISRKIIKFSQKMVFSPLNHIHPEREGFCESRIVGLILKDDSHSF